MAGLALAMLLAGCAGAPSAAPVPEARLSYDNAFRVDRSMELIEERVSVPAGVMGVKVEIEFVATAPASASDDRFGDILVEYGRVMPEGTTFFGAWSHSCDEEAYEDEWGCLTQERAALGFVELPAPDGTYRSWLGGASSCWDEEHHPEAVAFRVAFSGTQGTFEVRIKSSDTCPVLTV